MCGIVGLWGRFEAAQLLNGLESIAHRGPDDQGHSVLREDLFVGQRRLSIIDLSSTGHQPMVAAGVPVTIVYNGEIYNYRELRDELLRRGHIFRGGSDTEVILNLYLEYGDAMLARLNGIFALAIWDGRAKRMLLARDPVGVKPLYMSRSARGFAFASEIKALFASGAIAAAVNPGAVLAHLGYLWSPGEETIALGVRKLLPGQALWLSEGAVVEREWFFADLPKPRMFNQADVADVASGLVDSIRTAVRRQMVADVPVGAFLSGGLDSSSIVAFAREFTGGRRLQCFTIAGKEGGAASEGFVDDFPYAVRVAKHLGVDLQTVHVGPEMADRLATMVYHLDEPTADPAALNTLFISELARSQGIKVLLSGSGGDDIFTGYRRHYALNQEHWWIWIPPGLRKLLAGLARRLPVGHPVLRRIGKALSYADYDEAHRLISYFLWLRPEEAIALVRSGNHAAHAGAADLFAPMLRTLSRLDDDTPQLQKMLYLECKHFLADHNLNYADKMGMAAGVEIRVPLLDLEVIKFASEIPLEMRQRGAVGKWVFKKAMEPYLPRDVIYRPKTGFGAPLRLWFRGKLKPLVEDVFSESSLKNRGLFDPRSVAELLTRDTAGKVDATYPIFSMMCIELWCRRFLDA
ncbi:asparagine synthase (glutamine-hydrolyzing) [Bradyrhizobium sp.]|uniref:asparagine synthase (glutamine-hydrolyzing) n=1 Tax=Bradyrhizobium sp. TaxID=376 RepID=UPI003C73DCCA